MLQIVKEWAGRQAARLGAARAAVESWLVAHRQGFQGFVLGVLVGGLLAARVACTVAK